MSQPVQAKQYFQPATWGGLVLWLHILCGALNKWPSANDTPTRCWTCKQPTDEDTWQLLYERINT